MTLPPVTPAPVLVDSPPAQLATTGTETTFRLEASAALMLAIGAACVVISAWSARARRPYATPDLLRRTDPIAPRACLAGEAERTRAAIHKASPDSRAGCIPCERPHGQGFSGQRFHPRYSCPVRRSTSERGQCLRRSSRDEGLTRMLAGGGAGRAVRHRTDALSVAMQLGFPASLVLTRGPLSGSSAPECRRTGGSRGWRSASQRAPGRPRVHAIFADEGATSSVRVCRTGRIETDWPSSGRRQRPRLGSTPARHRMHRQSRPVTDRSRDRRLARHQRHGPICNQNGQVGTTVDCHVITLSINVASDDRALNIRLQWCRRGRGSSREKNGR